MVSGRRKMFPTICKKPTCKNLTHEVFCDEHSDQRYSADKERASASRRGYGARWQRYRLNFLARNPLCVSCGKLANEVDHIKDHRGSYALFWDTKNHQSLCKSCHSIKTQKTHQGSWNTHKGLQ